MCAARKIIFHFVIGLFLIQFTSIYLREIRNWNDLMYSFNLVITWIFLSMFPAATTDSSNQICGRRFFCFTAAKAVTLKVLRRM